MNAGKLITGLLAFFLVCALVTGQCLCASRSVLSVIIYEEVSNAYGPVYDAHRCDPVGTVYPESGSSLLIEIDSSWLDGNPVCIFDGDIIEPGGYSWGWYAQAESDDLMITSVTESHIVSFTFAEINREE